MIFNINMIYLDKYKLKLISEGYTLENSCQSKVDKSISVSIIVQQLIELLCQKPHKTLSISRAKKLVFLFCCKENSDNLILDYKLIVSSFV